MTIVRRDNSGRRVPTDLYEIVANIEKFSNR
jgi:hypothetical protein